MENTLKCVPTAQAVFLSVACFYFHPVLSAASASLVHTQCETISAVLKPGQARTVRSRRRFQPVRRDVVMVRVRVRQ